MEHRCRPATSAAYISVERDVTTGLLAHLGSPVARSGTPPPCLISSESLASASNISAWRSDSLTSRSASSKDTTRYSTCSLVSTASPTRCPSPAVPHHPTVVHLAPCPSLSATMREVAVLNISHVRGLLRHLAYLYAPGSDMACRLLRFWPFQWCADSARSYSMGTPWHMRSNFHLQ